jgi:hypothetical protein
MTRLYFETGFAAWFNNVRGIISNVRQTSHQIEASDFMLALEKSFDIIICYIIFVFVLKETGKKQLFIIVLISLMVGGPN